MSSLRAAVAAAVVTVVAVVAVAVSLTVRTPALVTSASLVDPARAAAAPELVGISHFDNTEPLTLASLRGRVVLVDFWTYTCINCRRTFPFLRALHATYPGLTVLGVHSPEFGFEKDHANVARAVADLDVTWPVAEDPQMATWRAFGNQYWPAKYLLDRQGRVRYTHFGEGDEKATEDAVRALLAEDGGSVPTARTDTTGQSGAGSGLTPETYFGSERGDPFFVGGAVPTGRTVVRDDRTSDRDLVAIDGRVTGLAEALELHAGASVSQRFSARDVYATSAPVGQSVVLDVTLDGAPVPTERRGASLVERDGRTVAVLAEQDLLHLVTGGTGGQLSVRALTDGARIYTFTYGG